MNKRFKIAMAIVIVALMAFIPTKVSAIDYYVPEGAITVDARFMLMDIDVEDADFSMVSEDYETVIHVSEDMLIYFEDFIMVRDTLEDGQTLAEVLDNRNLVVTFGVVSEELPAQVLPIISIRVLYEEIMPLDMGEMPFASDLSFEDVQVYDWFYNSVVWALNNGIMNGINDTEFAPNGEMTRAMLVTVLWRYADMPGAGEISFADVASGTWYSAAVAWAAENEIVMGYDDGTFGVNDFVNREQMYTILYRYMNFAGLTIMLDDEMRLRQFTDADDISDWAKEAMHFMYDAGVMFRFNDFDTYARPQESASRGEIAGAMYFFNMHAVSDQAPINESSFEVGSVRLVVDGVELDHEPGIHHVHSGGYTFSASGIPFESWLESNLSMLLEIQYTENLQIVVDGEYGRIVTYQGQDEVYYNELRLIGISAESFTDGVADVSLPDEAGTYLLFIDVDWRGDGDPFTLLRYVFKIVK